MTLYTGNKLYKSEADLHKMQEHLNHIGVKFYNSSLQSSTCFYKNKKFSKALELLFRERVFFFQP